METIEGTGLKIAGAILKWRRGSAWREAADAGERGRVPPGQEFANVGMISGRKVASRQWRPDGPVAGGVCRGPPAKWGLRKERKGAPRIYQRLPDKIDAGVGPSGANAGHFSFKPCEWNSARPRHCPLSPPQPPESTKLVSR